jgi:hypothetical protein
VIWGVPVLLISSWKVLGGSKMKRVFVALVVVAMLGSACLGTLWTESFDTGVGRLDQTTGNGDALYLWNEAGHIDGEFVRYPHENKTADTRYASLDTVYNVYESTLGFSAVFTPIGRTDTYWGKSANIGFIGDVSAGYANMVSAGFINRRSGSSTGPRVFAIMINYAEIYDQSEDYLDYSWGTEYFVDFLVDGEDHIVSASLYEGTDQEGVYVGTISMALDPTNSLSVYRLGLLNGDGNTISQTSPYITWGELDEISLTIVPEPTTLSLFALAGLLLRRRKA